MGGFDPILTWEGFTLVRDGSDDPYAVESVRVPLRLPPRADFNAADFVAHIANEDHVCKRFKKLKSPPRVSKFALEDLQGVTWCDECLQAASAPHRSHAYQALGEAEHLLGIDHSVEDLRNACERLEQPFSRWRRQPKVNDLTQRFFTRLAELESKEEGFTEKTVNLIVQGAANALWKHPTAERLGRILPKPDAYSFGARYRESVISTLCSYQNGEITEDTARSLIRGELEDIDGLTITAYSQVVEIPLDYLDMTAGTTDEVIKHGWLRLRDEVIEETLDSWFDTLKGLYGPGDTLVAIHLDADGSTALGPFFAEQLWESWRSGQVRIARIPAASIEMHRRFCTAVEVLPNLDVDNMESVAEALSAVWEPESIGSPMAGAAKAFEAAVLACR